MSESQKQATSEDAGLEELSAARASMAMVETVLAGSIAALNRNAVSSQEHARQTRAMALTKVCARIAGGSRGDPLEPVPGPFPAPAAESRDDPVRSDEEDWSRLASRPQWATRTAAAEATEAEDAAGRPSTEWSPEPAVAVDGESEGPAAAAESEPIEEPTAATPSPVERAAEEWIDNYRQLFRALGRYLRGGHDD